MKKHLVILMLMLGCCVSMSASKWYATFGTPAGNGAWDAETCTYSWIGSSNNLVTIFDCAGGKLDGYTTLHLVASDYVTGPYRVCFMNGGSAVATIAFYSAGEKNIVLTERDETKNLDFSTITHVSFGGVSNAGSVVVKDVYLSKPMSVNFDDNGKYTVDFTDISVEGNVTFDAATGLVNATGSGNLKINIGEEDFTNVTNIATTIEGTGDIVNFLHVGDKINGTVADYYSSKFNANPSVERKAMSGHVNSLYYNIKAAGSFTLKSVVITSDVITGNRYALPSGCTDLKDLTGTFGYWASTVTYPKIFEVQGASFGDGDGTSESTHVTITDYDYLTFVQTATSTGLSLRVWIWDGTKVVTLYPHPIADAATSDYTQPCKITSPGVYVVKVTGYDYLKGVKAANDWGASPLTVNLAYASKGTAPVPPVISLSGAGVLAGSAKAILSDATVTSIYATGITSPMTLTSANPNCLFSAGEGKLLNSSNVIVDGTCANLVLADKQQFAAPAGFTAATASFSTTLTDAGAATITLPFAVSALPEGITAYTLDTMNGSGRINATMVTAVAANQPVLIKGAAGNYTFTASETSVVKNDAPSEGLLTGTYQSMTVAAGMYLLQKHDSNVAFYVVPEGGAGLKPFHAYLNAGSTEVKDLVISYPDATGITSVGDVGDVRRPVFNLSGQVVDGGYKGIVIVNGKKMLNK